MVPLRYAQQVLCRILLTRVLNLPPQPRAILPLYNLATNAYNLHKSVQLSKYPALNNFEQQTNVPKVYVVLGLGALYFFLVFFNIAGEFLVNTAGFVLPAYYSMNALFSANKIDDTQVCTWIILNKTNYWANYFAVVNCMYTFKIMA